jgi:hypothetical protein
MMIAIITGEQDLYFLCLDLKRNAMLTRDISIWLDNYDDIFSDFDPRPYSERALSDDFLREVRKVCKEKDEVINDFVLLIPASKRSSETETIIIKRLQAHFKKYYHQYLQSNKDGKKKTSLFLILGMVLMFWASFLSSLSSRNLLLNAAFIILEPSGWFLVWYGLDDIFYHSKQKKNELSFYAILAKCKISFTSIS